MQTSRSFGFDGCSNCLVGGPCGGHPLPIVRQIGCASYSDGSPVRDTDDMSPHFQKRFWKLWDDVGGLFEYSFKSMIEVPGQDLPHYLPLLQHRWMRRKRLVEAPIVALKLFSVIGKRKNGQYGPRFRSALDLRAAYRLKPDAKILLVGVDHDPPLESFWAHHRISNFAADLRALEVVGVTVPNFSYFTCVPRFQILRNRKRILLVAERLSESGVRVAVHTNANTPGDWDFWNGFYKEHTELSLATIEFQTGCRADDSVARQALAGLIDLQQKVGRPLHPILVGAARFYKDVQEHFARFTLIDSQPFMQAVSRQQLIRGENGRLGWSPVSSAVGAPIDDLIDANLRLYPDKLNETWSAVDVAVTPDFKQLEFASITSMPQRTAQPVA